MKILNTLLAMIAMPVFASPSITSVVVNPHTPWDGKVDITYAVSGDVAKTVFQSGDIAALKILATDSTGEVYEAMSLSGDKSLADGIHTVVWDVLSDGFPMYDKSVTFNVACEVTPATYCVIDLSAGSGASKYAVNYLMDAPSGGFNVDTYKTTKLVLRRVNAGSYKMQGKGSVTLTKPFYLGIFEVTQNQWKLVTGSNPSYWAGASRLKCPVETVSYNAIRGSNNGAKWPTSSAVDSTSFMGKLRSRTGLNFDLPTEAQWEYACRAGTTTSYSFDASGNNADNYMWYYNNARDIYEQIVGAKRPNAWGFYDMHGNIDEWCLDWAGPLTYGQDPKGPSSGSDRIRRGGSYGSYATGCTSSSRFEGYDDGAGYESEYVGLRLARCVNETTSNIGGVLASAQSPNISVGVPRDPVLMPVTGVTFDTTLSISMSCASEGATIHYTTDGSEPTMESPVYKRFRISEKTTVKARAFFEDGTGSEIVTAEYALGQCPDSVISTTGGETFYHNGNQVSIAYDCEEGVVHYTTDGSDPTKESPVYEGPFITDESMVVKAKAFSDNYFDSAVVTATLTREWEQVATPVITAADSFTGAKTKVEITSATEGATIRYTLNGSDPNSHAKKYTGPFYVTEGCTIKAYAVLEDYTNSGIASKTITKVWGIGDSVALPDQKFTTSGDAEWVDAGGEAMKSGAITDNQKSILSTTFVGKGVLSFKWKVSCEDDEKDSWDHAAFFVDGAEIKRQDGITDWHEISHSIETDGSHTVEWVYVKDDAESDNDDCMWVKDIVWMPEKTQTSEVKVETEWLKEKYPTLGNYYFGCEEKASETAANGINKVWEAYLIGLDPTDSAAKFVSSIAIEDGKPIVSWNPDLGAERAYKLLGSTDLKTWEEIPKGEEAKYNFFKVTVEMK